jgi:hypothetical protein
MSLGMTNNELRRCWTAGYDCAIENDELSYWTANDERLLVRCEERDADVEQPAGWAAWLMGYAARLAGEELEPVNVCHAQKSAEVD